MTEQRSGNGDRPRSDAPGGGGLSAETRLAELLAARPELDAVLRSLDPGGDAADAPTLAAFARTLGLPVAAVVAAMTGALPEACARLAETGAADSEGTVSEPEPAWLAEIEHADTVLLDVRPLIAAGRDPFLAVMTDAGRVPPGGGLIIDAPFDPQPLRRVLAGRGFATWARTVAPGHVQVWCRRTDAGAAADTLGAAADAPGAAPRIWADGERLHIDVRGLAPPRPMTAILRLIDQGRHRGEIVVHHEREPLYLLPELADRGWSAETVPGAPGEVRLILRRGDG